MASRDLLFEIGTEELPARFMPRTLSDVKSFAKEALDALHIGHGEILSLSTPRRIVLYVKDLEEGQQDSVETMRGPAAKIAYDAEGNPTKALQGFARSRGIDLKDLKTQKIGNAEYVVAEKRVKGKETLSVLPEMLETLIKKLSFPKNMYWSDKTVRFARPVRWLVALYGGALVSVEFAGVKSGNVSRGHRFMGSPAIVIKDAKDYAAAMAANSVVIDPEERKKIILSGIAGVENELGAKVDVDPALLEENVHLNEYPVVFYGSFDREFLEIPEEVLTLSMAKNQRYFPVRNKKGKLLANFVGVSNNKAKDMSVVRDGNERVLRARLYDAAFFWKEDRAKSIDTMADELKNVTYQVQLGSVYDKVQRVKALSLKLAEKLGKDDFSEFVERAAELAKFDTVSSMVYEFAEVQGVMGREYARKAGEREEVALAIYEQYLPRFAGDELPSGYTGAILGMADRADTIAAIYKIGQEPTSSQDPYGLRRAARCINEIAWGLSLDVDMESLMAEAAKPYELDGEALTRIADFLKLRLQVQMKEKGLNHEVVSLALQTIPSRPLQAYRMAETLQKVAGEEWFGELITAAVRVKNILAKAGSEADGAQIDESRLTADAETALYKALKDLTEPAREAVKACKWEALASALSQLAPVISKFFEDVMVMDKDETVRRNRLALLCRSQEFFMLVGDFSLLK